jgi:Zn finger protein HypA/HybF involved in hydrogenase expression
MRGEDEASITSEPALTCNHCGEKPATTRRQNTLYVKDELNYVTLCELCHKKMMSIGMSSGVNITEMSPK